MGPPAIPKGTPHPLTLNVKPAVIPRGKVWVQGKLRDKASNAARHQQGIDERRAEKALRRATLGRHIYAYSHLRTNQVVYSLSRFLEEGKILPQLLDHGKKTRPPSIRRDFWTPYFSVHFPTSKHGLTAYRQLRELSVLRQTAPPDSLITNSETSHFRFHPSAMYDQNSDVDKGLGRIMSKRHRARVLMDQKAASVADVAFVLGLQDEVGPDQAKPLRVPKDNHVKFPRRQLKNMRKRRSVVERLDRQYDEQLQAVQNPRVPFSESAKVRIAYEQNGEIYGEGGVVLKPGSEESSTDVPGAVQVLWADLRDAAYAETWPNAVTHGELERRAQMRLNSVPTIWSKTWSSRYVHGNLRDVEAEAGIEEERRKEADEIAAQQDAEARDARRSSPARSERSLPDLDEIAGHRQSGRVELPPKPLGTRIADTLMFWRR